MILSIPGEACVLLLSLELSSPLELLDSLAPFLEDLQSYFLMYFSFIFFELCEDKNWALLMFVFLALNIAGPKLSQIKE